MIESSEKYKVLLVDDERGLLELGKNFLERYRNIQAVTAISSFEALSLIELEHFDGIISDYQMPVMDGFELFQELRAKNITIPFIIYTGKGREEIAIKALNMGVDRYVQKGKDLKSQYHVLAQAITQEIDHWKSQKAIETERDKAKAYLNIAEVTMMALNTDYEIEMINKKGCEIIGAKEEDIIGKNWVDSFVREQDKEEVLLNINRLLSREIENLEVERELVTSDNVKKIISWNSRTIIDQNDKAVGILSSGRDITALKRTEKELRYRYSIEKLITNIIQRYSKINKDNISEELNKSLKEICKFLEMERCYIFLFSDDRTTFTNNYGWNSRDENEDLTKSSILKVSNYPWLTKRIFKGEKVDIPKIVELPDEAKGIRDIFIEDGVQSAFFIPIQRKSYDKSEIGGYISFVSFDKKKVWLEEDISMVSIISEAVYNTLERIKSEEIYNLRLEFEETILKLSGAFINAGIKEIDDGIRNTLKEIALIGGLDRGFLFILSEKKDQLILTHGWHAKGYETLEDTFQSVDIKLFGRMIIDLNIFSEISFVDLDKYHEEVNLLRQLTGEKIQSLSFIPLHFSDDSKGFFGFTSNSIQKVWSKEEEIMLKMAEQIVTSATEQKRNLIRLKDRETQYNHLVNNLNVGVYRSIVKAPGNFVIANKACATLLGHDSVDELMKANISDFYTEDEPREEIIKKIINEGEQRRRKRTLIKKDGSLVIVALSVRVVFDEYGEAKWFDGVMEEIKE
jgi:PAS domain S-box-containing protein